MRPVIVRRSATTTAAIAASLLATALAGCGGSPGTPSAGSPASSPALADGPLAGVTTGPTTGPSTSAPSACSLLRQADVLAVAATFREITVTIDGHTRSSQPPLNLCGFNQKGVSASDGGTLTVSGDDWAQLTVIADGDNMGDYSPDGPAIDGLGHGAYWDPGTDTVVILVGQKVFQVEDDVPVNVSVYPNLDAVRQKAATALAVKILGHIQPGA